MASMYREQRDEPAGQRHESDSPKTKRTSMKWSAMKGAMLGAPPAPPVQKKLASPTTPRQMLDIMAHTLLPPSSIVVPPSPKPQANTRRPLKLRAQVLSSVLEDDCSPDSPTLPRSPDLPSHDERSTDTSQASSAQSLTVETILPDMNSVDGYKFSCTPPLPAELDDTALRTPRQVSSPSSRSVEQQSEPEILQPVSYGSLSLFPSTPPRCSNSSVHSNSNTELSRSSSGRSGKSGKSANSRADSLLDKRVPDRNSKGRKLLDAPMSPYELSGKAVKPAVAPQEPRARSSGGKVEGLEDWQKAALQWRSDGPILSQPLPARHKSTEVRESHEKDQNRHNRTSASQRRSGSSQGSVSSHGDNPASDMMRTIKEVNARSAKCSTRYAALRYKQQQLRGSIVAHLNAQHDAPARASDLRDEQAALASIEAGIDSCMSELMYSQRKATAAMMMFLAEQQGNTEYAEYMHRGAGSGNYELGVRRPGSGYEADDSDGPMREPGLVCTPRSAHARDQEGAVNRGKDAAMVGLSYASVMDFLDDGADG